MRAAFLRSLATAVLASGGAAFGQDAPPPADPGPGHYVEAAQAGARDADAPPPTGFRITLPVCREAARQNDPLAATPACRDMLQAAQDQARLCQRAFDEGNDAVAMSTACRQAAMATGR